MVCIASELEGKHEQINYIAMSRPLIREPDLVSRWKSRDRRRAECKSDNLCFGPGLEGGGIYCVSQEHEKTNKRLNVQRENQ